MSYAAHNQMRSQFARELDAIGRRARSRLHDPRAPRIEPRPYTRAERIARAEEAQRIVDLVIREKLWAPDRALDQWVERVYCAGFGMADAGAAGATPLGVLDIVASANVIGFLQAELGVSLATGVSAWASQIGGTTLDMTQGTGSQQPAYAANDAGVWGRSTVTSDGSNDVLNSTWNPPAPGTTPTWVRCAANRVTDIVAGTLFAGTTTTTMRLARVGGATVVNTNGTSSTSRTMSVNTWYRTESLFNNSTTDYLKVGSSSVSGVNTGNNDPASWRLFATSTGGANPGNFSLQKLLVCNADPTALQKALLDGIDRYFYNGNITL